LWLLVFRRLEIDRTLIERIRKASDGGTVVYAVDRSSALERLLVRWLLRAYELGSEHEVLWLDQPGAPAAATALIQDRDDAAPPIRVVGLTVLWAGRPIRRAKSERKLQAFLQRFVFGWWDKVWSAGASLVHAIAAVEVDGSTDGAGLVDELNRRLLAAREVRIGAPHSEPEALLERVLRNERVFEAIQEEAAASDLPPEAVINRARNILHQMQAKKSASGLNRISWVLRQSWRRLFDGFVVDELGVEKIRAAAKKGPVLLLPTHRSHVDYLLMSDLFVARDLVPPHIAAGLNLAFFPMGWIFRTAGAFFLRRRYAGRELYGTLMHAYLGEVLAEGHNIEIFIEGGRSRTGRVLAPRFGMLSVIADHALKPDGPTVSVIPASIGYDRVAEAKALTRELAGGVKEPESFAKVLRIPAMFGKRPRFGRINVQIGEPIDMRRFLTERGFDRPNAAADVRHSAIRALGYHVLGEGSSLTAITPTSLVAAAVLASPRSMIERRTLDGAARFIADIARAQGARFAMDEHRFGDELDRAIELLRADGALVVDGRQLTAKGQGRIRLDYYKNQMVQHIVAPAIAAAAVLALVKEDAEKIDPSRLRTVAQRLASVARHHFVHHAGDTLDELTERTLETFEELELIIKDDAGDYTVGEATFEGVRLLAGTFESLIEAQYGVARAVAYLATTPRSRRILESEILGDLHRQLAEGKIQRFETCQIPLVRAAIDWLCHEGLLIQYGDEVSLPDLAAVRAVAARLELIAPRSRATLPPPPRLKPARNDDGEQSSA